MTTYHQLFIGGDWVTPATEETYELISASTEEQMASAEVLTNLSRGMNNLAKELESAISLFVIE